MSQVQIPDEHFTKSVKREYSDHQTALIRELVQNSVDAGATRVDFTMEDGILTCSDNGCGMNKDVLVGALLTLSGTFKGPNSIGGFGAAKALILFQHVWYKIHTTNIKVEGKVLQYDLFETDDTRKGTKITVQMDMTGTDNWNFNYLAKKFLETCQTSAVITYNGEAITSVLLRGVEIRDLGWAKVYVKRSRTKTNYCHVRIHGITMFSPFITDIDQSIVIEITKPSIEILTVNRDGFTATYQQRLSELIAEIIIEKESFGAAYNLQTVYRGKDKAYRDATALIKKAGSTIMEALRGIIHASSEWKANEVFHNLEITQEELEAQVAAKAVALAAEKQVDFYEASPERVHSYVSSAASHVSSSHGLSDADIKATIRTLNDRLCDLNADFTIFVKGQGFNKIPIWLEPKNMGKRLRTLARLWKHCLKIVLSANEKQVPYAIGWVLDHEAKTEALTKNNEGVRLFLLNPLLDWTKNYSPMEAFMKMIMIAAHEVAHLETKWHDESFTGVYDRILLKTTLAVNSRDNSWWKEYLKVKEETL